MSNFRTAYILPNGKETIVKEFTIEDQINLTKALAQNELLGLKDFVSEHIEDNDLSIIDFLLCAIWCREISAGGSLLLSKEETTYEISLEGWKEKLGTLYHLLQPTVINDYYIEFTFCPWDKFLRNEPLFQITKIDGKEVSPEDLPVKLYHTIHRHFKQIALPQIKLLEPCNEWTFDFTPKAVWYLLSLLFERDLGSTYETIFILQKECNLECRSLTPGEFMFFSKQYQALVAARSENKEDTVFDELEAEDQL